MNDKIIKCKYSGDENDEFCANCDGITVILDGGEEVSAVQCGGYSVETEEIEPATLNVNDTEPVNTLTDHAEPREQVQTIPSGPLLPLCNVKGVTVEIQAESGISLEVKGTWYKLAYTEKVLVPEGADLELERRNLWDRVNNEVDSQVQEVMALNNSK